MSHYSGCSQTELNDPHYICKYSALISVHCTIVVIHAFAHGNMQIRFNVMDVDVMKWVIISLGEQAQLF